MTDHDPGCPPECRTRLKSLEDFRSDQTKPKEGINAQLFDRLDKINAKLNWIGGGIALLSFLILLAVAMFGGHFTH